MAGAQQSPMIEELNKQFVEAFKTRNFAAVAGMFTNDAVMLPPRREMVAGRSNIQSFWTQANRIREVKFETGSIMPLGVDVVREIGTFRMRVERAGGGGDQDRSAERAAVGGRQIREILGKYVFLWRKVGSEWKLETSIWNRNRPEGGGRGGRGGRRRRAAE